MFNSLSPMTPSTIATCSPQALQPEAASQRERLIQIMKSMYNATQQAEYLHLQAETDLLRQRLEAEALKQQGSQQPTADHS